MECSKYVITNTGETSVSFNYQRCDDAEWQYQVELEPNQTKNIWLINNTYSIADSFRLSVILENWGDFPPTTITATPSNTPTPSVTPTNTTTVTPTNTNTPTNTTTVTPTPTITSTVTPTNTETPTPTPSATAEVTPTPTPTNTETPTNTPTVTQTPDRKSTRLNSSH